eukprot:458114-Amphidinium_carterae.2
MCQPVLETKHLWVMDNPCFYQTFDAGTCKHTALPQWAEHNVILHYETQNPTQGEARPTTTCQVRLAQFVTSYDACKTEQEHLALSCKAQRPVGASAWQFAETCIASSGVFSDYSVTTLSLQDLVLQLSARDNAAKL